MSKLTALFLGYYGSSRGPYSNLENMAPLLRNSKVIFLTSCASNMSVFLPIDISETRSERIT